MKPQGSCVKHRCVVKMANSWVKTHFIMLTGLNVTIQKLEAKTVAHTCNSSIEEGGRTEKFEASLTYTIRLHTHTHFSHF